MNIQLIPHVFRLIVENAFGFEQVAGGGLGATMMNGIKRGLFSNEAGEGSAPNIAATASTTHPVNKDSSSRSVYSQIRFSFVAVRLLSLSSVTLCQQF